MADNYPEPGKRPLSSTSPTIMENEDGTFYLAIGGSGGSRIFGSVFQVILNIMHWGLDVSEAVEYGRLHDQLYPTYVDADDVYPPDLLKELERRGHNITGEWLKITRQRVGELMALTVSDVNRVAAVIQAVMKEGRAIYGTCGVNWWNQAHETLYSCERLAQEWDRCGLLVGRMFVITICLFDDRMIK